jgi:hypothetical protein
MSLALMPEPVNRMELKQSAEQMNLRHFSAYRDLLCSNQTQEHQSTLDSCSNHYFCCHPPGFCFRRSMALISRSEQQIHLRVLIYRLVPPSLPQEQSPACCRMACCSLALIE